MNLSEQLKAKGWTVKDAAEFFGVSRQKLHSVLVESVPTNLWVCAVNGIPKFAASMKKKHPKKKKQNAVASGETCKEIQSLSEFECGDIVIASKYIGIIDEGEEGVITEIKGKGANVLLEISFHSGADKEWFPLDYFYNHFGTTGLNINSAAGVGANV